MSQIIHISDEMYAKLAAYAAAQGQTVDAVAAAALQEGVQQFEIPAERENSNRCSSACSYRDA